MKRTFLKTGDGSITIHIPEWDEQYHSKHGAIAEANHVFIKTGLHHFIEKTQKQDVAILEIGFGTGLNALLTLLQSQLLKVRINYTGIEAYPISNNEVSGLNYSVQLKISDIIFKKLHEVKWEDEIMLDEYFSLTKQQLLFNQISALKKFDLVYFDAFGARVQPELWTEQMFKIMFTALKSKGVLVTYAAKGSVRRAMQEVGFSVERLPGPPGKREMLRATKI